jgi:hypothetical protein
MSRSGPCRDHDLLLEPRPDAPASANIERTRIDRIMTSMANADTMKKKNESHPQTIAPAPTSPRTCPYVNVDASDDAAAPAMCCQKAESKDMTAEMVKQQSAI